MLDCVGSKASSEMSSPVRSTPTFQFHANPLASAAAGATSAQQTATGASQGPPPLSLAAQSQQPEDVRTSSVRAPVFSLGGGESPVGGQSPIIAAVSRADSFSLGPFRGPTSSPNPPSNSTLTPQLLTASSRASSSQRSASPQPPAAAQMHQRRPTLARMGSMGNPQKDYPSITSTATTPLLSAQISQPNLESDDANSNSSTEAATFSKSGHAVASPVTGTSAATFNSSNTLSNATTAQTGANSYYEQYEATVNRIRARRLAESSAAKDRKLPTPERRRREYRVVGGVFSIVILAVCLLIYFLYPRVPLWQVDGVVIKHMRLWSDGSANFAIQTSVGVQNSNFVMTGIESVTVKVMHNNTIIGGKEDVVTALKWAPRAHSQLILEHNFSPIHADRFAELFAELSSGEDDGGLLTLQYEATVVTSENFRLRNLQVFCTAKLQLDAIPVPPHAEILTSKCEHTEQTG